jgi:hypothetical protein
MVSKYCVGRLIRLSAAGVFLAISMTSTPAVAAAGDPKFAFGVFSSAVPEQVMSLPKVVFKAKSTTYGWAVVFPNHRLGVSSDIDVQEILELPSAPVAWILPGDTSLSHHGRRAEMRTTETISKEGYILKKHTFLPGDPLGIWNMTIIIDGVKSERFEFTVADPSNPESDPNKHADLELIKF